MYVIGRERERERRERERRDREKWQVMRTGKLLTGNSHKPQPQPQKSKTNLFLFDRRERDETILQRVHVWFPSDDRWDGLETTDFAEDDL